ncbi:MAG: hypothetical protein ACR2KU_09835 [Gammaproteobacteria bacterium]
MREYTHNYANARIDFAGRGFLGFGTQTVTDVTGGLTTVTSYRQDYPFTGLVNTAVTRLVSNDIRVRSVINEYDNIVPTGASVYPYLKAATQRTFDPDTDLLLADTITNNSLLDSYGNVRNISVQVTGGGASHTTTTLNQFGNDPDIWRLGRLRTSTATHENAAGARTRTSSFVYYPQTDLLWKETVQPGTVYELITTYGRDDYGNIDATTVSTISGEPITPRTTATQYNGLGRYLFRVTNAVGHIETHTYDRHHGGITELIGPNGLTTHWIYDVLGRQANELRASGTSTGITYDWCSATLCPWVTDIKTALFRKTIATSGAPTVVEYYDSLNRVVAVQKGGFGAATTVQTVYNAKGQVTRVSRPYLTTGTPALWTDYSYDRVGRVTAENLPGTLGSNTSDYDGFKTTLRNPKNQQTVETSNALGQTVIMVDHYLHDTRYEYDPVGNLTKVTDSELNEIVNTYNIRGHKVTTNDPDMGVWTYKYNVLGELIEQKDARLQVSSFVYDKLGRMTRRTEGADISTWEYDLALNGKGKLAKETSTNGFARGYTYDGLSRPRTTTTTIGGVAYTSSVTYDGDGRVVLMNYPSSFSVRNVPWQSFRQLSPLQTQVMRCTVAEHVMQENEIQVTGSMVTAGRMCLLGFDPNYDSTSEMVADIYRIMELDRLRAGIKRYQDSRSR